MAKWIHHKLINLHQASFSILTALIHTQTVQEVVLATGLVALIILANRHQIVAPPSIEWLSRSSVCALVADDFY